MDQPTLSLRNNIVALSIVWQPRQGGSPRLCEYSTASDRAIALGYSASATDIAERQRRQELTDFIGDRIPSQGFKGWGIVRFEVSADLDCLIHRYHFKR